MRASGPHSQSDSEAPDRRRPLFAPGKHRLPLVETVFIPRCANPPWAIHKYLTLVYQIDLDVTRLLWVGKERTIESFREFFTVIGDEIASKIAFVCSDMWEPYLKVIRQKCSEA